MCLKISILTLVFGLLVTLIVLFRYQDTEVGRNLKVVMFCLGFTSICVCFGFLAKNKMVEASRGDNEYVQMA